MSINRTIRHLFLSLCLVLVLIPRKNFSQGTFYAGVYPGGILIIDETTGQTRGQISLKYGLAMSMTPSPDRTKFYAVSGQSEAIEVIDIKSRQVVEAFKLSQGNRQVRLMRNTAVHPDGIRLFSTIRASVKEADRYTLEKPQLVMIDVREKKITKTLELPREYSGNGVMRVSPDGKFLYYIFRDILIIDIDSFKIVDKIELRDRPLIPGTGLVELGSNYETYDQPDTLYFLFNSADPSTNRKIMGIAQFNLADRSLDFFETNPEVRLTGFVVTPDKKRAFGVRSEARLNELYVYDLEGKRLIKKLEYVGHTRTRVSISSDGKRVYLEGPGNTIDYLDAETLAPIGKHIDLSGDFTSFFIFPQ